MKTFKIPKKSTFVLLGLAFIVSVFLVLLLLELQGKTIQPLAFNHKVHADNDLACADCHINFMDYSSSGRPTIEICAACHEESMTDSSEEKRVVESVQAGEEIEWKRLYRLPEDVYFSHRRHVAVGGIECATCHGDIGESVRPPTKPEKMTMDKCMNCHDETQADNDCIACHR